MCVHLFVMIFKHCENELNRISVKRLDTNQYKSSTYRKLFVVYKL